MQKKKRLPLARLCLFAVLSASTPIAWSQSDAAFGLVAGSGAGLVFGEAKEYVYNQNYGNDYKNSELDWPFSSLPCATAALELATRAGFFAELSFGQAFAAKVGTMSDSDYLNGDGVKTHYSESDCYAERLVLLDLRAGWDFRIAGGFSVGAFGAFSYSDLKLSARDGYYQYPTGGSEYRWQDGTYVAGTLAPWVPSQTKVPLYGTGILYEQSRLVGAIGLRTRYEMSAAFSTGVSFAVSPMFSYCVTTDNHELRTMDFLSELSKGLMLEPGAWLELSASKSLSIRLSGTYRYFPLLKGDLVSVDQGSTSVGSSGGYYAGPDSKWTGSGDSGAQLRYLQAGLGLRLSI